MAQPDERLGGLDHRCQGQHLSAVARATANLAHFPVGDTKARHLFGLELFALSCKSKLPLTA